MSPELTSDEDDSEILNASADDVMNELDNKSIKLIVTDSSNNDQKIYPECL